MAQRSGRRFERDVGGRNLKVKRVVIYFTCGDIWVIGNLGDGVRHDLGIFGITAR